ncbi:hypothetical protein STEG23_036564, partial [Scotinomys teguina]
GLLVYLNHLSHLDLTLTLFNFFFDPLVLHLGIIQLLIATPACFLSPFDWKAFSQPFTLRLEFSF